MAGRKSNGPWWNSDKGRWFVWHEGRKVNLRTAGEAEATRRWHRLMAGLDDALPTPTAKVEKPTADDFTVQALADAFVADAVGRMTPECLRNYRLFLNAFTVRHGDKSATQITEADVDVTATNPKWSQTYRAGFIACLVTVYRWAVRTHLLKINPIDGIRKPRKASRGTEAVISEADHQKLVTAAEPLMADFLNMLWLTGARPGEIASLTADMVNRMTNGVMALKEHKSAHKGKTRLLILNADAVAILKRRAEGQSGLIFPISRKKLPLRMNRLRKRAGVEGVIAYGYRHTFATDALANGVPDATVAALLGHADTSMVHRHYSHLTSRTNALRDALNRVR